MVRQRKEGKKLRFKGKEYKDEGRERRDRWAKGGRAGNG